MSGDLDARLRDLLKPVAPSEELTQRLLADAARRRQPTVDAQRQAREKRAVRAPSFWVPVGLAATLLIGVGFGIQDYLQRTHERERGMQARRQVIEALHVTNQKLTLAYETVRAQLSTDNAPGA
jgi:hypothetical protein